MPDDIDVVLIMTVNPGFAGQKLVPATLKKIANMKKHLVDYGYGHIEIEVDGNVSYENARKMQEAGADNSLNFFIWDLLEFIVTIW